MNNKSSDTWDWFKSFFNEYDGASTTRALSWIWTMTMCVGLLFVIVFNAIKTHEAKLPVIDSGYIMITGAFLAAKVGQHIFGEQTPDPNIPQIPPIPPMNSSVSISTPQGTVITSTSQQQSPQVPAPIIMMAPQAPQSLPIQETVVNIPQPPPPPMQQTEVVMTQQPLNPLQQTPITVVTQ